MHDPKKIRNIAIVAHIDHGKTTLLDAMLKEGKVFRDNEAVPERAMDSYSQEMERGITIFAKHTCINYNGYKINIIDTPGHADFSGEVERILGMVSSVILLIDAAEGPKPQTRFVLSQALKMGMNPIVVLNKIDKPHADPDSALDKTFDLFVELGANDEQLDFPYCYASGFSGYAMKNLDDPRENLAPLFDFVIEKVPAPTGSVDNPFLMQAATLSYDEFLGRQAAGRILEGEVRKGDPFTLVGVNSTTKHKVTRIEGYLGLKKVELEVASVGDIVNIAGAPDVMIGDTLCHPDNQKKLPAISLGEPTVSVDFIVSNSPFVGRDGKHVTMNKIRDRLQKERRANISLRIEEIEGREDAMRVCGRGELHLAILIEAMRREGYEFSVSKPQVIIIDGKEPIERVVIEVPEGFSGAVIEELSRRKGEMQNLQTNEHGITTLEFLVPTRGLMGYRNEFLTVTRGEGILTSIFEDYCPHKGEIPHRQNGVLIANCAGKANAYAIFNLQERATIFVTPTNEVYEGMIVGQNSRDNDLAVNITKEKQLSNVRSSGTDEALTLTPPRRFTLEQAIDYIQDDELVEVTPHHIRLRKRLLSEVERKRKGR